MKSEPQLGWIMFAKASSPHKYSKYLKPGFDHILIVKRQHGIWSILEPVNGCLKCDILPYKDADDVIGIFKRIPNITKIMQINFTCNYDQEISLSPFNPITCVSIVKYICGIKSWHFTPYQLYKFLLHQCCTKQYICGIDNITIY